MSATAAQNSCVLTQSSVSGSRSRALAIRFALAALAVVISYCFRWEFLRFLTSEANLRLDLLAGIHLQRIASDTVMWRGGLYHYENACTFVDVWFGSIPLLWTSRAASTRARGPFSAGGRRLLQRANISRNLMFMFGVAIAMFCFNVIRLSVSDVLFAVGLPWDLAHNVISGVAYFLVWIWIWRSLQRKDRVPASAA